MCNGVYVLLSGSLTFGVPLILAVRELRNLRHGNGPDWRDPDETSPTPLDPFAGRKPLPDCLVPKPLARVPELVD